MFISKDAENAHDKIHPLSWKGKKKVLSKWGIEMNLSTIDSVWPIHRQHGTERKKFKSFFQGSEARWGYLFSPLLVHVALKS